MTRTHCPWHPVLVRLDERGHCPECARGLAQRTAWDTFPAEPHVMPLSIAPKVCRICADPRSFKPSHDGSKRCESGSIASGGNRSHCSCDTCF